MKRNRYSSSLDEAVLNLFDTGHSMKIIADGFNVPVESVRKVIKSKYPDMVGRKNLPIKDICKTYLAGETMESLAAKYDVSSATIKSRLVDSGVELRTQSEYQRLHFFNEDYFEEINTSDKAYWLGFLFADGSVTRMMDVSISLKDSDRGHLEKFLAFLDYEGPGCIMDIKGTGHGIGYEYVKVSLRSRKMVSDLISHGCIPNKSLVLSGPEGVPEQYERDFIRGVVDGDGYISKTGFPSLEIVGSHDLLQWISERIESSSPTPHKSIWRVRKSGSKAAKAIRFLYEKSNVSLDRKEERAKKIYE